MLSCAFINNANAQLFKGEAFAGASIAQVDGDECYGYKRFSGQLGAGVLLSLTEQDWLDLGFEIVYNPKGALRSDTLVANSGHFRGTYDLKRWRDGYEGSDNIDLSDIRTLDDLSSSGLYDDTELPPTLLVQNSNTYSKQDLSICADFRIRIWEGLHAQLRYQYSLMPIRIRLFEEYTPTLDYKVRQQYNNQISLRLTYIFGEDLSKLNREIQKEEKKGRY